MTTRICEFCKDWTPEYLEEFYGVSELECGACHGTKELDTRACFCCAREASECGCDADWDDNLEDTDQYYNWEEEDYMDNRLFYENELEDLEELPTKGKM